MCVHARRRDAELRRDLLRRPAGRDRAKDVALPVGQGLLDRATVEDPPGEEVPGEKTD
jgi:hypothetical protein